MKLDDIKSQAFTDRHWRYLRVETAISVAITALLSTAFAWAIFGSVVPVAANDPTFRFDAVAQALIVAFMSAIVPAVLLGRRMRAGLISNAGSRALWWPSGLVRRSLAVAGLVALPAAAAHLGATSSLPDHHFSLAGLLVWKAAYGSIIAAISTAIALRLMLAQSVALEPEGVS